VFVTGSNFILSLILVGELESHFHPNLKFAGKAGVNPSGAPDRLYSKSRPHSQAVD
jgi:hypothetical protein